MWYGSLLPFHLFLIWTWKSSLAEDSDSHPSEINICLNMWKPAKLLCNHLTCIYIYFVMSTSGSDSPFLHFHVHLLLFSWIVELSKQSESLNLDVPECLKETLSDKNWAQYYIKGRIVYNTGTGVDRKCQTNTASGLILQNITYMSSPSS